MIHPTGKQAEVWGTKGLAELERKDACGTVYLHVILRKGGANKCGQKTFERPKVSVRREMLGEA